MKTSAMTSAATSATTSAIFGILLAMSGTPALAASHDHAHEHGAPAAAASDEFIDAEVRAVDRDNGKLTLKHGPIPRYEMAAMTMAFRVADPALLSGLAAGDRVRFTLDKVNGRLVVVRIAKVP